MLKSWPDWVSSVLAGVECRRALKRIGVPASVTRRADAVLNATVLVKVDEPVLRLADRLGPSVVRSLDAIHLATALSMGDDPAAFVSYDDRLAAAARTLKLHVLQPGRA
jgi:predicted nucleic acid-binding protein